MASAESCVSQIQAVARPPAAKNGKKGVTAAFSVIGIIYPLVAVAGFYVRFAVLASFALPEFCCAVLSRHTSGALTCLLLWVFKES